MAFDFFKRILRKIKTDNVAPKNGLEYNNLAPIDDIPKDSEYLNALMWAFEDEKVRNIAISGPYGSGKSSIIETLLKNNKNIKKRSISVSMASFASEQSDSSKSNPNKTSQRENTIEMRMLEEGILKQLFYKVDYSKIPQSRYRKIHKIGIGKVYTLLVPIIFLAVFWSAVFARDKIGAFVSEVENICALFEMTMLKSVITIGLIAILTIILLANIILSLLSNVRIKEIKLPANTVVERKQDPDSIFSKNTDEIMYFFEVTKYEYVFFEDIDRFDNIEIFVKLRELNTLINNYDNIKRRVRFIYAVKDDMFNCEDRTKFFDFIIPVIPAANATNVADEMIKMLKVEKGDKQHDISKEYIMDIAPFIPDMRTLLSINNEFIMYKMMLQKKQDLNLMDEDILSLIIFKNIYPNDFAELQLERGIVKNAFENISECKKKLTQSEQESLNSDMNSLKEFEDEFIKDIQEFKIAFMSAVANWKGHVLQITIKEGYHETNYSCNQIMKNDFDISDFENAQNLIARYTQWNSLSNYNEVLVDKDKVTAYVWRWKSLKEQLNGRKDELQKRIIENKKNIRKINEYSLNELIEQFGIDNVLPADTQKNDLLVFMLRKGYINDKYASYINYFKGESMTKNDMNFILSVKNNKPLPHGYTLTEIERIVSYLQDHDYRSRSVYNYDLLEHLLSSKKYENKLNILISQLSDGEDDSWDFIDEYIDKCQYIEKFTRLITHSATDMWECVYNDFSMADERKTLYLRLIFAYAEINDIKEQNSEKSVVAYMVDQKEILRDLLLKTESCEIQTKKFQEIISELGIKFTEVETDDVDPGIIDYIFDNNYYVINGYMIKEIVKHKNSSLLSELDTKNYSTIKKLGYSSLTDYIDENLEEYMDNVFFNDTNKSEDIETIIELVKEFMEDDDVRKRIISHEEFTIAKIDDFCGDIQGENNYVILVWNQVLEENKVEVKWKNVNIYYERFGFTTELETYIESKCDTLIKDENESASEGLIVAIFESDINDEAFEKLLSVISSQEINIPFSSITVNKMKILIDKKGIPFTLDNYNQLAKEHQELEAEFILINQPEFLEFIDSISIDSDLLIDLIKSQTGTLEFKQRLINAYAFDNMTAELAQLIADSTYSIDLDTFWAAWDLLDVVNKNKLFLKSYRLLDCNDLQKCFKELRTIYPGFENRTKRHNVSIKYSDDAKRLCNYLEEIGYITSHKIIMSENGFKPNKLFNTGVETRSIQCVIKSAPRAPHTTIVAN